MGRIGRISDLMFHGGHAPAGPSPLAARENVSGASTGGPFVIPRPPPADEVAAVVGELLYARTGGLHR
jgi:hypothetical protein